MANSQQNRYQPDPASGGVLDTSTGDVIRPGDANWNPEWTSVLQTLQSIPKGQHAVFDAAGHESFAPNDVPWYEDPALLGAIGLPAAAGALGAFAAPATGEFGVTSTPFTGGLANTAGNAAAGGFSSSAGASGAGGAASGLGSVSTLSKLGGALRAGGAGIGAATNASANNRYSQLQAALEGNQQNITAQNDFVNQLMSMAGEEDKQRATALNDVYKASYANNPRVSPFDPVGAPKLSPQYMATIGGLANQGQEMLSKPASYQVSNLPKPTFSPIDVTKLPGYSPSTAESTGNWLSAGLSGAGSLLALFGLL